MPDSNLPETEAAPLPVTGESLDDVQSEIRGAFARLYPNAIDAPETTWIVEIYPERVIIERSGKHYSAGYSRNVDGVVFALEKDWTEVENQWIAKAVKAVREALTPLLTRFEAYKAGARHSAGDVADFQVIHDLITKHGVACKAHSAGNLVVTKDAAGRWRWIVFSSSAFEDRDNHIVTKAALDTDAARMTATANFGPLRWRHAGAPDVETLTPGPGLDIGDCDYSAMVEKVALESGTFREEIIGERLAQSQDETEVSRGFFHPADEPAADGIFHHIYTFERSLLLPGEASNYLTKFYSTSTKGVNAMANETENIVQQWTKDALELVKKLGGDAAAVKTVGGVLTDALSKQQAVAGKLRTKATTTTAITLKEDEAEKAETVEEAAGGKTVGEMSADEFAEVLRVALAPFMEMWTEMSANAAKETADTTTKAHKELDEARRADATLQAQIKKLQTQQTAAALKLKALTEELPRGLANAVEGYRPTEDAETIVKATKPPEGTTDTSGLADFWTRSSNGGQARTSTPA